MHKSPRNLKWLLAGGALRIRGEEKWAARFRRGQETFEDEARSGGPPNTDFTDGILRFLEKHCCSSSREIGKAQCSPKTTVLRVLHDLGLHFLAPKWISCHLSEDQKTERVELSEHMLETVDSL
jgi:hypothetical protein